MLGPVFKKFLYQGPWKRFWFLESLPKDHGPYTRDTALKELKTNKKPLQRKVFHGSCDSSTTKIKASDHNHHNPSVPTGGCFKHES